MTRLVALLLIIVHAVSSILVIKSASASASIPKPSIPEFTIETVSFPYDVPPTTTTTIDPYTGKETVTTQPGYHVENKTTQIKIKNQPFTPYQIQENGVNWTINFFYNIRLKGHFSEDWHYYRYYNGSTDGNLRQSYDSEYTVVPIDDYLPTEGQVDVQIEALIGYEQGIVTVPGAPGTARIITGESSGWGNIQTVTAPNSSEVPEQSQNNPNATRSGFSLTEIAIFAVLGIVIALLVVVIALMRRRIQGLERKFRDSDVEAEGKVEVEGH